MSFSAVQPSRFRFGSFELDRRSGELRKHGVKIRLQEKPLRVLEALLEHPGQAVTREELRGRLWAADTFVDFDNGLNTAVNKLRAALRDSADHAKYVETLGGRGYRFVAPVEAVPSSPNACVGGGRLCWPDRSSSRRLSPPATRSGHPRDRSRLTCGWLSCHSRI